MDLRKHYFNGDWSWIDQYRITMGDDDLSRYINRVYIRMDKMKPGDVFDIVRSVIPENFDLFIKSAEWFMHDFHKMDHEKYYEFNDEYTQIRCIKSWKKNEKKETGLHPKKNT